MTPHELYLKNKAFIETEEYEAEKYHFQMKQKQDLMTYQALLISRWVWEKKVDIKKFLNFNPKKEMTADDMLQAIIGWNAELGGEVVYRGSKK